MTVRAYLAKEFSYTHENQAFNQLYRILNKCWGSAEELVTLVGNFSCNASELDALVMRGSAITVIDFKNFGGNIAFNENGPWYADGVVVKGGSQANPYRQIHANKFALLDWLNAKFKGISEINNLGHISGMVLFQKPIEFDVSSLPPKLASWFHVVDFDNVIQRLSEIASPKLSVTPELQAGIVKALNVPGYQHPGDHQKIIEVPGVEAPYSPALDWTPDQAEALQQVERLLQNEKPEVLLVSGMSSTGKSTLLGRIQEIVRGEGRDLVPLAPNAGIAGLLHRSSGIEFRSVFSHVYSVSDSEEVAQEAEGCIVHPLRSCMDAPDAVYVVDEAQLLSDSYFDLGGERYGSGHTLSDFLMFSGLGTTNRKLIVLADNYQIKRAGEDKNLQEVALLESKGLTVQPVALEKVVDDGSRSHIIASAVKIVGDIKAGRFSSLDIESDGVEITNVGKDQVASILQKLFGSGTQGDAVVIHFSHASVAKTCNWIRTNLKGFTTPYPQPGDRIELRSFLRAASENEVGLSDESFIPHGSYGSVVSSSDRPIEFSQPLKGRDNPVTFRFREIEVRFDCDKARTSRFMFLEDYLLAEKPELDRDAQLALKVFAEARIREQLSHEYEKLDRLKQAAKENQGLKEDLDKEKAQLDKKRTALLMADPFYNAARLRYAYACTGHHAQGRLWSDVVIDAGYGSEARANEGYFRWLYTSLTRAAERTYLANFTPITPLDQLTWKPGNCVVAGNFSSLFRLPYEKDRDPDSSELKQPAPEGFSGNTTKALINLWLYVSQVLATEDCRVVRVKEDPYQERYVIASATGTEVVLVLHYNKDYDVTRIRVHEGDNELGNHLIQLLHGPVRFADALAQRVFEAVRSPIEAGGFMIEAGVPENYQLRLSLSDGNTGRALLKVYYTKEGKVSTIMPEKVSDESVLGQLTNIFEVTAEGTA